MPLKLKKQTAFNFCRENSSERERGFTLIELLLVVVIISIVIAVGSTSFSQAQKKARDNQRKSDLKKITLALESYYAENNSYPLSIYDCLSDNGTCSTALGNRIYLDKVAQDPEGKNYKYCSDNPSLIFPGKNQSYTLRATLEGGGTFTLKDPNNKSTCTPS